MNDHNDADESLVSELRQYFERVDPVPPLVIEAAKVALGWQRLDADLAELLTDSALEAESLAGVRGASADVRSVSFGAGELTIELEIRVEGAGRMLLGLVSPPSIATIEIQSTDGDAVTVTETDRLGRFRAQLPAGGNIRLRLLPGEPDSAQPVETSWITI